MVFTVVFLLGTLLLVTLHRRAPVLSPTANAERADRALQPERDQRQALQADRQRLWLHVPTQTRLNLPRLAEGPRVTPVFARDTQFVGTAH